MPVAFLYGSPYRVASQFRPQNTNGIAASLKNGCRTYWTATSSDTITRSGFSASIRALTAAPAAFRNASSPWFLASMRAKSSFTPLPASASFAPFSSPSDHG